MRPRNGEQPDSMSDRGAGPRPFFLRFTAGRRFCLLHAPERRAIGAVLYVHPLAEEMNKSRRMAALQARALAASGWFVLQVDLFGCGDSDGDFGDADWQRWLADVDEAFFKLCTRLMAPDAQKTGTLLHIATHDIPLADRLTAYIRQQNVPKSAYEFAMLYGIQRQQQLRLAREGQRLRVLISYGEYWFPWYMRRLAERPANVWFVVRTMFG